MEKYLIGNKSVEEKNRALSSRIHRCSLGSVLLIIFLISSAVLCVLQFQDLKNVYNVMNTDHSALVSWVLRLLLFILIEFVLFWIGIGLLYTSSTQLGIKWRVIGIACGFIPIVHLFVLLHLIKIAMKEAFYEKKCLKRDTKRQAEQICATKYPILMVHGVFFRDFKYLNYWGRIPEALQKNGARIYYGNHQSAASVTDSGKELAQRIAQILAETGAEKVNVIAHSKGGLDTRAAIAMEHMGQHIASLTTINTPHRGCEFADYLLEKIPAKVQTAVATKYNSALKALGDENPDFIAAVMDLRASACEAFNEKATDDSRVLYQSVGSKLNRAGNGRFPLNYSYHLVKYFDGPNDGLVSKDSFAWGENFQFVTVHGKRGVSHGDMIDLNRENIDEFDVREFYVELVADLKQKGL